MGKKKGSRPRVFNDNLDPIRADQIDLAWEDVSYHEREDKPLVLKRLDTPGSSSDRNVKGEGLGWGDDEQLACLVASSWLWELGELIEDTIRAVFGNRRTGGRPREHTAAEWLLFLIAVFIYGSLRATNRNLNTINRNWKFPTDQKKWNMLKRIAEQAWPDHPNRRLSEKPYKRDNEYYFRTTYMNPWVINRLQKAATGISLEAARFIDLLNPSLGSISRPDPTQMVAADGTFTLSAFKNPPPGKPGHKPNHRCDPGVRPMPGEEKGYCYCVVAAVARGPHRQERITLFAEILDEPGQTDANLFTQKLIQIRKDFPHLTDGILGVAFDMNLRSADCDRLMDHGVQPISKTPRTSQGKTAAVNLGPHTFKTPNGEIETNIVALNGTPTFTIVDGDGHTYYQPLRRQSTQIKKPGKRTRKHIVYTKWEIPDHPLVPQHMTGATTRIRSNSTPEERKTKPHTRRTRGLRPIPETDPLFKTLFGPRQDIESNFSTYKRQLDYDRLRTRDKPSLRLNWIAYSLYQTNTALVAHHARTAKDMTRWYGQHFPNARAGPIEKAA